MDRAVKRSTSVMSAASTSSSSSINSRNRGTSGSTSPPATADNGDIELGTYQYSSKYEHNNNHFEKDLDDGDGSVNEHILRHTSSEDSNSTIVYPETAQNWKAKLNRLWYGPSHFQDEIDDFKHNHLLYKVNRIPGLIANRMNSNLKRLVLAIYFISLILIAKLYYHKTLFETPTLINVDSEIVTLTCSSSDNIWIGYNDKCGLDAKKCLGSFKKNEHIFIKCPAFCGGGGGLAYDVVKYGDQQVQYQPVIIKSTIKHPTTGQTIFRGDSYPCMSAFEEGLISQAFGGIVELELSDDFPYDPTAKNHDDTGFYFNSFFPASFTIKAVDAGVKGYHLYDLTLYGILLGVLFTLVIGIVGYNGEIFFFTTILIIYTTIVLCSDSPVSIDYSENLNGGKHSSFQLISVYFERFIPLGLSIGFIWEKISKYTFHEVGLIQRLVFLLGIWITGLDNLTFERLPIDRLIISDITTNVGSFLSFLLIIGIIISCAVIQAFKIWRAGWFPKAFFYYIGGVIALFWIGKGGSGILQNEEQDTILSLRVHHWVIGMSLIFGTKTRWTGSYLMQGLCIGLILNGIGRWGFASVLELHSGLIRDRDAVSLDSVYRPSGVYYSEEGIAEIRFSSEEDIYHLMDSDSVGDDTETDGVYLDDRGESYGVVSVASADKEIPLPYVVGVQYRLLVNDVLVYVGARRRVVLQEVIDTITASGENGNGTPEGAPLYLRAALCAAAASIDADERPHLHCSGWSAAMRY